MLVDILDTFLSKISKGRHKNSFVLANIYTKKIANVRSRDELNDIDFELDCVNERLNRRIRFYIFIVGIMIFLFITRIIRLIIGFLRHDFSWHDSGTLFSIGVIIFVVIFLPFMILSIRALRRGVCMVFNLRAMAIFLRDNNIEIESEYLAYRLLIMANNYFAENTKLTETILKTEFRLMQNDYISNERENMG